MTTTVRFDDRHRYYVVCTYCTVVDLHQGMGGRARRQDGGGWVMDDAQTDAVGAVWARLCEMLATGCRRPNQSCSE